MTLFLSFWALKRSGFGVEAEHGGPQVADLSNKSSVTIHDISKK